ncbi:MAG TPA: hypothetical protein VHC72_08105, partial [Bryobacteraceae bacterium]|nr:hypothetical protein [Bryobacteraceae bacterium]
LSAAPVALFVATGSVFLLVVYNYWTLGAPWYLAIAYPWTPHQYFQALCWLSVVALAITAWLRIRGGGDFAPRLRLRISPALAWSGVAAMAAVFLIYPAYVHMNRDRLNISPVYAQDDALYTEAEIYHNLAAQLFQRGRQTDSNIIETRAQRMEAQAVRITNALRSAEPARTHIMTPESLVEASLDDFNRGDFAQCIYDARRSLKLRPGMPAAWNNIVLCNGYLGKWAEAVQAAEEGVRLEPEIPAVRRNLEWAISGGRRTDWGD